MSILGSFFENKPNFIDTQIAFTPNDSSGDLPGARSDILSEKYNVSPNPVEFLSFDNIFTGINIASGIFSEANKLELFTFLQGP